MNSLNMLEQPIILYYWHYQTPPTPLPPPRPPLPIQRPISPPPLPPPPPVKIVFSQLLEEQKDFVKVHNCINIFDWFKGRKCDTAAAAAHTFPSSKSHNSLIQLSHPTGYTTNKRNALPPIPTTKRTGTTQQKRCHRHRFQRRMSSSSCLRHFFLNLLLKYYFFKILIPF